MLRCGSLFSGAGLCDLGLHWAGFNHQWFCEVDAHCRAVLARHWQGVKALGNGIVPHQAYAVAACILRAEELPVPSLPTL